MWKNLYIVEMLYLVLSSQWLKELDKIVFRKKNIFLNAYLLGALCPFFFLKFNIWKVTMSH